MANEGLTGCRQPDSQPQRLGAARGPRLRAARPPAGVHDG